MQLMRMTRKPPGVKMIILEMIAESMRAYAGGGDYGLLQNPSWGDWDRWQQHARAL